MRFAQNIRSAQFLCNVRKVCENSVRSKSSLIDQETQLPVFRRKVQVCGQLYQEWKEKGWKRYCDVPKEGITAEVEVYDNEYIVGDKAAVNVLIFTGVPSTFAPFGPLVSHLSSLGVRVVIPKFPEMNLTKESKYYRHSPQERVEIVKAALEPTRIATYDLLLSHSTGVYSGITLWKDPKGPAIRSMGWLNPLPAEEIVPMQPYWLTRGILKLYETEFRQYMEKGAHLLLKAMGNGFAGNAFDTVLLAGYVCHYSHVRRFESDLQSIRKKQVPLLLAFSDNDRIITQKMNKSLVESLGFKVEDADFYDKQGHLVSNGMKNEWIKMLRFKCGGHLAQLKHPLVINEAVEQHLHQLKRDTLAEFSVEQFIIKHPIEDKDRIQLRI